MITTLFAYCLRLYPPAFYALFAEEMADVFDKGLRDAQRQHQTPLFCLKEFVDLPMNILIEHVRELTHRQQTPLHLAQTITRTVSLVTGFIFFTAGQKVSEQGGGYAIYFLLALIPIIGLFVAWKWQRTGGLLAILGGIPVAIWVALGVYDGAHDLTLAVLSSLSHNVLFIACGGMFIYLSFQNRRKLKSDKA